MSISIVYQFIMKKETCELFVHVLQSMLKVNCEIIIVYDSTKDNTVPSIERLKKNITMFIQF